MEYIIRNVQILFGENLEVKNDHGVWIKNGEINKILPEDDCPNKLPSVDGNGGYLIPGLIDLHVHMMWDGSKDPVATLEEEGYEQMLIRAVSHCQNYINNGITTVRDIGSVDDIAIHVAKGIKRGLIKGPNLIASGRTLTMTGGHDPFWARFVDGKAEALKGVREQVFKGAEVIKVSSTGGVYGRQEGEVVGNAELSMEEQQVICNEAHKFGLKVASHAIGRDGILNSIQAGIDTIEHGHFLDDDLVKLMEEKGTAWVPTLYIYKQIASLNEIPEYAKEKAQDIVEKHEKAFKEFFNKNILIGAGSDAGSPCTPHTSLMDEILLMYEFVPNIVEILKTATVNAGKILDRPVGQIQEGFKADLTLLKENPLEDLNHLKGVKQVYIGGKLVYSN
ncbi:metal-dependent hydrolase family protein [Virgibacillus necropolis]|uniref:Imidazolonepropionase n=1 Tax=Virgibacillus necropolis TaxID=163877 RepID=A0A221MA64_9BACI|nr:amidohydrolase family protein [Virgibacillus necropolis]ASN04546.1 imidazolonepropionase [Virgibacillus necropolis]